MEMQFGFILDVFHIFAGRVYLLLKVLMLRLLILKTSKVFTLAMLVLSNSHKYPYSYLKS